MPPFGVDLHPHSKDWPNDKALAQKDQASASDPIDSSRLFPKVSKENCRENGCLDPGPAMVNCRRWLDDGRNQSCSRAVCSGSNRNRFHGTKGNYEKRK
jgi:hypothetical protein